MPAAFQLSILSLSPSSSHQLPLHNPSPLSPPPLVRVVLAPGPQLSTHTDACGDYYNLNIGSTTTDGPDTRSPSPTHISSCPPASPSSRNTSPVPLLISWLPPHHHCITAAAFPVVQDKAEHTLASLSRNGHWTVTQITFDLTTPTLPPPPLPRQLCAQTSGSCITICQCPPHSSHCTGESSVVGPSSAADWWTDGAPAARRFRLHTHVHIASSVPVGPRPWSHKRHTPRSSSSSKWNCGRSVVVASCSPSSSSSSCIHTHTTHTLSLHMHNTPHSV